MTRNREYFRGCHLGYVAALEMVTKHGKAFAQSMCRQLEANVRKRNVVTTDFDRGYAHAYHAVAFEAAHISEDDYK